ncbi:MAG: thioredoxin fold domain-containing protein [Aquificota bacterium]|nr:thioredoxin fold domain-containing protein [Aquificota bacterium]MDQ7082092.1 thioredoxin fold domain-containing protein [Aquificota bacterium]
MRVLILLLFVVLSLGSDLDDRWYPDVKEGIKVAREKGKLVMFYFWEEGCTYCKYMEEVVFVDPKVYRYMHEKFVIVPVDTDNFPPDLDRRFRVLGTPTFIIYDPKTDRIVFQIIGMQEVDEFLQLMTIACKKARVMEC